MPRAIELLFSVSQPALHLSTIWVANRAVEQGEVDRAMELLRQLEDSSKEEVRWSSLFSTWSRQNPVQLFERLDDLPQELRQEAARELDSSLDTRFDRVRIHEGTNHVHTPRAWKRTVSSCENCSVMVCSTAFRNLKIDPDCTFPDFIVKLRRRADGPRLGN